MAIRYFPFVRKEDYEAFRRILGDNIPHAYDDWFKLVEQQRDGFIRTASHIARTVQIDTSEFATWMTDERKEPTPNRLCEFAFEKGSRGQRD